MVIYEVKIQYENGDIETKEFDHFPNFSQCLESWAELENNIVRFTFTKNVVKQPK